MGEVVAELGCDSSVNQFEIRHLRSDDNCSKRQDQGWLSLVRGLVQWL